MHLEKPCTKKVIQLLKTNFTVKKKLERLQFSTNHRFSKFEVPLVVNLKHIFELFGLNASCFLIQKLLEVIRSSYDGYFWIKSRNKKGGQFELRSQLRYYNCTRDTLTGQRSSKYILIQEAGLSTSLLVSVRLWNFKDGGS